MNSADLVISSNTESLYWSGYEADFNFRRYLTSIGAARMIAKPILQSLDYKLWHDDERNKNLDCLVTEKMEALGLPYTKQALSPKITVNDKTYFWGQVLYDIKETKTFVTDFKLGDGNITAFESFVAQGNCTGWVTKNHLIEHYGSAVISDLDKISNSRLSK